MKRFLTFFIAVSSFAHASLCAMQTTPGESPVPPLEEIVLRKTLSQWEEKLHNVQNDDEYRGIRKEFTHWFREICYGRESLEAAIHGYIKACHTSYEKPQSLSRFSGAIRQSRATLLLDNNTSELIVKKTVNQRVFRYSGDIAVSPDNSCFALRKYCPAINEKCFIIAVYKIAADLSPIYLGYISPDVRENAYFWDFRWTQSGITIEGPDPVVIANPILSAALSDDIAPNLIEDLVSEVSKTELYGRKARAMKDYLAQCFSLDSIPGKIAANTLVIAGATALVGLTLVGLQKFSPDLFKRSIVPISQNL